MLNITETKWPKTFAGYYLNVLKFVSDTVGLLLTSRSHVVSQGGLTKNNVGLLKIKYKTNKMNVGFTWDVS